MSNWFDPFGSSGSGSGSSGVGIAQISAVESSVDGGNNNITITLTDGTTSSFNIKNGTKGSQGLQGEQGPQGLQGINGLQGATGNGIDSIEFTSSTEGSTAGISGATDTYTITFTNEDTTTFVVHNGADGSSSSTTIDIVINETTGDSDISVPSSKAVKTYVDNSHPNEYGVIRLTAHGSTHTKTADRVNDILSFSLTNGLTGSLTSTTDPNDNTHTIDILNLGTQRSKRNALLEASNWEHNLYSLEGSAFLEDSDIDIYPSIGISAEGIIALAKAVISVVSCEHETCTLRANGIVPSIDIPISIIDRGVIE